MTIYFPNLSRILLIWRFPGMPWQRLEIKIPRHSASVFYGDRHKFVRPIPRPPSFSRDFLSLPLVRLLVDLWTYRFFLLHKPPWNFAEIEFRPDHRTSRLCLPLLFPMTFSTVISDSPYHTWFSPLIRELHAMIE